MKNKISIISKVFFLGCVLGLITSCKKDMTVQQLNDQTTGDISNPDGLRKFDIGAFREYANNYHYFWPLYTSHCAGEYEFKEPVNEGPYHFEMWNLDYSPTNVFISSLYSNFYATIKQSNYVIDMVENNRGTVSEVPEDERNLILGSAYFMRGLSYFYLLHTWGRPYDVADDKWGVPLHLGIIDNREKVFAARATCTQVYASIESDLTKAKTLLPDPANLPANQLGRPTKPSAIALLAKTLVFEKKYPEAIAQFNEFIVNYSEVGKGNANYKGLLEYFGDNFHGKKENSYESLFEIQFSDLVNTNAWQGGGTGSMFQIYSGGPDMGRGNVSVRDTLFFDFKRGDIRKIESRFHPNSRLVTSSNYADTIVYHGKTIVHRDSVLLWKDGKPNGMAPYKKNNKLQNAPKKYIGNKHAASNPTGLATDVGQDNQMVLRVAEVYFLYAEALVKGGGDQNTAIKYLNKITRRAYGYFEDQICPMDYNSSRDGDLFTYLQAEKRKEFIGESVRWYDMVRWGIAEKECQLTKRNFTKRAASWPMPNREVAANPACEQDYLY